ELNDDGFDRLAATYLAHHRNESGIRRSRFVLSPKHAPPRPPGSFLHVDQMTAETARSHQEQNSPVGTAFLGSGQNSRGVEASDGAAPLHNGSFRSELCLPDRAKEIDFQFDGSEGFLRRKSACERHPHCRIGNIAKDSAVHVPMGFACCGPAANMTVARPSAISF